MPKKISRDVCLIKYREFPLRDFDKDDEVFFFPKVHSHYWLKLDSNSEKGFTKIISTEITKLYQSLGVENLIFFGDYNRNWISKFTDERDDYKPLIESVNYFKKHKISNRFKGAVKVHITNLHEFITHFYILTKCDGGFVYYHFLDETQNLLGFIHYSGEVQFNTLNAKTNQLFLQEIKKTNFVDSFRENTDRV